MLAKSNLLDDEPGALQFGSPGRWHFCQMCWGDDAAVKGVDYQGWEHDDVSVTRTSWDDGPA